MGVEDSEFFQRFARVGRDGFAFGWHEAGAGNLSYRLTAADVAACEGDFDTARPWKDAGVSVPGLAGEYLLVKAADSFLRDVGERPRELSGVVEVNDAGDAWRKVWGFQGGARPTSEFATHLLAHETRSRVSGGADRVVYHAHCPNVIALSTLLPADSRAWSRALWQVMTEFVVSVPEGVGVVPWMVPGGADVGYATAELMERRRAVVWTQHGLFVTGESFDDAFGLAHFVEKTAGVYLEARAANGGREPERLVSDAQLRQICEAYGVVPEEDFLEDDSLI